MQQLFRPGPGAVNDGHGCRLLVYETPQHTSDCPAGAHQQDASLPDFNAVAGEIAYQSWPVGGITVDPAGAVKSYQVDGSHPVRPGAAVIDVFPGLLLERQGDVQPASACLPERLDAGAEFVERGEQRPVVYRLPCLCGEQAMDPGRQAVRYRVADDGVVIHLIIVQQLLDYRVYSTVISQICYWVRPAVILALNSGHPLI